MALVRGPAGQQAAGRRAGALLLTDPEALRCFRFMNQVMRDQRIHSQVAERRSKDPNAVHGCGSRAGAGGRAAGAFLAAVPAGVHPHAARSADRSGSCRARSGDLAQVELLFFPTGGGKTEAYLGLAAYTFAIRRRQGVVSSRRRPARRARRGGGADALHPAAADRPAVPAGDRAGVRRRAGPPRRRGDLGQRAVPDRAVGRHRRVSPKRFEEADEQLTKVNEYGSHRLTVLQIQRCPWCGTPIDAAQGRGRSSDCVGCSCYCGDELAECPFAKGGVVAEGLPVLTVDEEIYRLTPAFVIATVDKFARLAREGEAAAAVRLRRAGAATGTATSTRTTLPCNIRTAASTRPRTACPPPRVHPVVPAAAAGPDHPGRAAPHHRRAGHHGRAVRGRRRRPRLLGPPSGTPVRPLIVASTATVRNAARPGARPVRASGRRSSRRRCSTSATRSSPRRCRSAETTPAAATSASAPQGSGCPAPRSGVAEVLLAAAQLLFDRSGQAADPYMTLVGYFNATRELAGMARYMADDVQTALSKRRPWTRASRGGPAPRTASLNTAELTSRYRSGDIAATLDQLAVEFDPDFDSTEGKRRAGRGYGPANAKIADRETEPVRRRAGDLDAAGRGRRQRLGLMLVVGQPKNTAEYIQASSRVGRDGRPARAGGHARELGPAPRPGPFRAVPALPRDVLRPGRGAVGDPVLADVAGTRHRRRAGQRRPRAAVPAGRTGCRRRKRLGGSNRSTG